ncbi:hypothetical protein EVAR_29999_1 [Eumeta japonica]|uniref:Uncharacterized protein n=1 Tax=Eumeta variegata TaxID=151549 RepID=A0A4C1VT88_EUMVA|nr:hypothetical protein EVAR_29999_1 [Eumeta japonica]
MVSKTESDRRAGEKNINALTEQYTERPPDNMLHGVGVRTAGRCARDYEIRLNYRYYWRAAVGAHGLKWPTRTLALLFCHTSRIEGTYKFQYTRWTGVKPRRLKMQETLGFGLRRLRLALFASPAYSRGGRPELVNSASARCIAHCDRYKLIGARHTDAAAARPTACHSPPSGDTETRAHRDIESSINKLYGNIAQTSACVPKAYRQLVGWIAIQLYICLKMTQYDRITTLKRKKTKTYIQSSDHDALELLKDIQGPERDGGESDRRTREEVELQ